ncbi:MAG: beta-propeller fold lactonase family protein, partial [Acidimicrobiales bacterium]
MNGRSILFRAAIALLAGATILIAPSVVAGAAADNPANGSSRQVLFVQTNGASGNEVLVYEIAHNGTLTQVGAYPTGGLGGQTAPTTPPANHSDYLSSQGSLLYDPEQGLLIAVNAGSDSISVFRVLGERLSLREILPSGGEFPASIAISHDLVYVLNAGGEGAVSGYYVVGGFLIPIPGSTRELGLGNTNPPNFLTSPGQVAFSPDGSQLLITTKESTNSIDVFHVGPFGQLSAPPVVNTPSTTQLPFSLTFAPDGLAVVGQAATSSLATYTLSSNGTLTNQATLSDGQTALCWVTEAGGFYYVANTGTNNVSAYRVSSSGALSLVGTTGIVASTDAGPIDMAATPDGSTLYVEAGLA